MNPPVRGPIGIHQAKAALETLTQEFGAAWSQPDAYAVESPPGGNPRWRVMRHGKTVFTAKRFPGALLAVVQEPRPVPGSATEMVWEIDRKRVAQAERRAHKDRVAVARAALGELDGRPCSVLKEGGIIESYGSPVTACWLVSLSKKVLLSGVEKVGGLREVLAPLLGPPVPLPSGWLSQTLDAARVAECRALVVADAMDEKIAHPSPEAKRRSRRM